MAGAKTCRRSRELTEAREYILQISMSVPDSNRVTAGSYRGAIAWAATSLAGDTS